MERKIGDVYQLNSQSGTTKKGIPKKRYGRGKFEAHENYIKYMEDIVKNPVYLDMPNAVDEEGRVNWQVSSGKTTSFYKYYQARFDWWVKKSDEIGVPGEGNSNDRFSITARMIHPTGIRPCRLCGRFLYVGYMYVNSTLANKWNKLVGKIAFEKEQEIVDAVSLLLKILDHSSFVKAIGDVYGDRCSKYDFNTPIDESNLHKLFLNSFHIKSAYLSPGFMANPPDRLDGFHDYGLCCRKTKDPGRSDENLRMYIHDRRAFRWWSEGDWNLTDALYNSAGPGICERCKRRLKKISPDHVGPLSCGFKQVPFFIPLCMPCNASRNRRMRSKDVEHLILYEKIHGESVASWQIRTFWDRMKTSILTDNDAKELSNILRSIQDYYLRVLYRFWEAGCAHFISCFLSPQYAYYEIQLDGLDRSTLKFNSYQKIPKITTGTRSLAARSVRIAFHELESYNRKPIGKRKLYKIKIDNLEENLVKLIIIAKELKIYPWSEKWNKAVNTTKKAEESEKLISMLLSENYEKTINQYVGLKRRLRNHFDRIGKELML